MTIIYCPIKVEREFLNSLIHTIEMYRMGDPDNLTVFAHPEASIFISCKHFIYKFDKAEQITKQYCIVHCQISKDWSKDFKRYLQSHLYFPYELLEPIYAYRKYAIFSEQIPPTPVSL